MNEIDHPNGPTSVRHSGSDGPASFFATSRVSLSVVVPFIHSTASPRALESSRCLDPLRASTPWTSFATSLRASKTVTIWCSLKPEFFEFSEFFVSQIWRLIDLYFLW